MLDAGHNMLIPFCCIVSAPPSKKSLNFHNAENVGSSGLTGNNVRNSKDAERAKSKKRDCDEMFLPLSDDDEDEDAGGHDEPSLAPGLYYFIKYS